MYYQSNEDNLWYWRLVARNGETIASGQGYRSKQGVLKGIKAVKRGVFAKVIPV